MATGLIINTFNVNVGSQEVQQRNSYLLRQKIDEFVNSDQFKKKFAAGGEFKFALSQNRLQVFKKEGDEFKLQEINTETIQKTAQSFANLYTPHSLRSTPTQDIRPSDVTGESNLHASYSLFNIPSLRRRIQEKTPTLLSDAPLPVATLKTFLPTGLATSKIKTTSLLEKALENAPLSKTRATFVGITDEIRGKGEIMKDHKSFLSVQNEEHAISLDFEAGKGFSDLFKEKFLQTSKDLTLKETFYSKAFFKAKVTKKRKFAPLESLYIKIPKKRDQLNTPVESIPLKIKQEDQEVELKGFICYETNRGGTPVAVAYFKEFNSHTGKFHWVKSLGGELTPVDNQRDEGLPQEIGDNLGKATDLYYDSDKNLFERAPEDLLTFTIE